MMYCCINSYAQEVLFKDHLFNDHTKYVEVKYDDNIFTITFQEGEPITLYSWEYEIVLDALRSKYSDIEYRKFTKEAGRLFYQVKGKILLTPKVKNRPVAGIMGFKSDYVYLYEESKRKEKIEDNSTQDKGNKELIDFYKKLDSLNITKQQQKKIDNSLNKLYNERDDLKKDIDNLKNERSKKKTKNYSYVRDLISAEKRNLKRDIDMDNVKEFLFENKNYDILKIPDSKLIISDKSLLMYKRFAEIEEYEQEYAKELVGKKVMGVGFDSNTDLILDNIIYNRSDLLERKLIRISALELERKKNDDKQNDLKRRLDKGEVYFDYKEVLRAKIDSLNVEITETFIERVEVFCRIEYLDDYKDEKRNFNRYTTLILKAPIGISTLNEINNINEINKIKQNRIIRIKKNTGFHTTIKGKTYKAYLSDIITFYRPELKNKRRDVSPADTTFMVVKGGKNNEEVKLFRQTSEKLFEFKVFSDFVGVDGTKPNGLVQIEFDKKMFLSPRRYYHIWGGYRGIATYIKPSFTLSKLEDNNKYAIPLISGDNKYINTLDLMRHQIYKIGADLNLQMIHIGGLKSDMYVDLGAYYSRSGISDTIKKSDSGLDVVILEPKVKFKVQTDERYFLCIDGSVKFTRLLDSDVKQLRKYDDSLKEVKNVFNDPYYTVSVMAGYSPTANTRGKLFFRYRYSGALRDGARLGYSQIQLGYSYYFNL